MAEIDKLYPEYQFAKHKGYGTKLHRELLLQYGMCPVHRRSFMKKYWEKSMNNSSGKIGERYVLQMLSWSRGIRS